MIASVGTPHNLRVNETFLPRMLPRWRQLRMGNGALIHTENGLRLALPGSGGGHYADAQIDDYAGLPRRDFLWRPPLRLVVEARTSGPLLGTAGFGFWNNPLATAGGWPALPAAIWFFFAAPPSDMPLAAGVPGHGWKAACMDATTPAALAWAPFAPPVLALNNLPRFKQRVWPRVERALRIAEQPLAAADTTWREYMVEWRTDGACFSVDGTVVFQTERVPRGPLGFIAWIDNQWAVVTPQGRLGWGVLHTPAQWLDLRRVSIEPL